MTDDWNFAKKREELIEMTEEFIKIGNPNMAMDVTDAIIVAAWDYYGEKDEETLK